MNWRNGSSRNDVHLTAETEDDLFLFHGACADEVEELRHYSQSRFDVAQASEMHFPLPDEACVEEWAMYAEQVAEAGTLKAIYPYLPQLQFPVQRGLSQRPEYQAAVRRGETTYPNGIATGLNLELPDRCRVMLHPTMAGRLAVIIAASRADFVTLVRAFMKKGEPDPIPDSMGAVILGGFNNFHRIHGLRCAHLAAGHPEWTWMEAFQQIKQQKHLYQDRFVILSPGPYSGVPAAAVGLDEREWEAISLTIRLEHECAHYMTRRVFGSMRNNLLDELIADYCGLVKATGAYQEAWARRFFGIDQEGVYRDGGRLENYRGEPPLSNGAFAVLVRLTAVAIENLRRLHAATATALPAEEYGLAAVLTLARFTLEELAAPGNAQELIECFKVCAQPLTAKRQSSHNHHHA